MEAPLRAGRSGLSADEIRAKLEAAGTYLTEHPEEARYTDSVATARIVDGLRIVATGPDGASIETDFPSSVGGGGSAPAPGWYFRAALATCVLSLIVMRGAFEELDVSRIEVEVDSESDDRGILGVDENVPAGPLSVTVRVRNASDDVRPVVEWAFAHCPVQDAAARAVPVSLEVV